MSSFAPSCGAAPWDGASGFAAMADKAASQSFDSGQGLKDNMKSPILLFMNKMIDGESFSLCQHLKNV